MPHVLKRFSPFDQFRDAAGIPRLFTMLAGESRQFHPSQRAPDFIFDGRRILTGCKHGQRETCERREEEPVDDHDNNLLPVCEFRLPSGSY
jgi:hypothetical protein